MGSLCARDPDRRARAAGLVAALAGRPLPPALAIACLAALAAHGGLLFTALLAAGFSRFMIGLWPAITTAALFGFWAVLVEVKVS